MLAIKQLLPAALLFSCAVHAAILKDICSSSYISASLASIDHLQGITIKPESVYTVPVYNASISGNAFFPDATFSYCSVSFTYSHTGRNDIVNLTHWLPEPDQFRNRYLATGGGGYAINSGNMSLPGGPIYGAVSGMTDGGFGTFQSNAIATFLLANGTLNYENVYMFGYQAIHELTVLGKALTKAVYNMSDHNATLYTYYQGCSEGGREGWSQVQRFADQFDGASIGAPAFRFAFQQVQHLYSNVVEQTMNYYPPPCELQKIVNETIVNCDALDGKQDGVVSRTDLCLLEYNISGVEGMAYSCPATANAPAQNGTVSAKAIAVARKIMDGLHTSHGKQVYFTYTPSSTFTDAQTRWNGSAWDLSVTGLGGSFIEVLLDLKNGSNLPDLNGVTYDTLRDWIYTGWNKYNDVLMTNWPDLSDFKKAGGKVIHFHGESDFSIPTASSVRYWESVRQVMNPNMTYNASITATQEFYRLFLVPGGSHCSPNAAEPNGPWPQTSVNTLIDWVEHGVVPVMLEGTVQMGENKGQTQQICTWPLRPFWKDNETMVCEYDQRSIDTWLYDLDAFDMPVY